MTVDEMELLGRFRDVPPLPEAVSTRARLVLEATLAVSEPEDASLSEGASATASRSTRRRGAHRRTVGAAFRRHRAVAAVATVAAAALAVGAIAGRVLDETDAVVDGNQQCDRKTRSNGNDW